MEDIVVSVVVALETDPARIPVLLLHLEQQTFPASQMEVLLADVAHNEALQSTAQNYGEGAPIRTRAIRASAPGMVPALNAAVSAARGELVIFLDEDLLPSPRLVETHHRGFREQGTAGGSVGPLRPHPQLERTALTAWFLSGALRLDQSKESLHYLDWRRANLAICRDAVLAAGGFDEDYEDPQFADADLAYRLQQSGVECRFLREAVAYIAYPSSFTIELQRHYAKGQGARRLYQRTRDSEIVRRYPIQRNALRRALDSMFVPFYIRACQSADDDTAQLGHVYRRVFACQRSLGWRHLSRDINGPDSKAKKKS